MDRSDTTFTITSSGSPAQSKIGVYQNGAWYLDKNGDGEFNTGDSVYSFGLPGWSSVVGDWDADGMTDIGVYKDGSWYLDKNGDGEFNTGDSVYSFGLPGWSSVAGDWDDDGMTDIGVYKDGSWYLDKGDGAIQHWRFCVFVRITRLVFSCRRLG